jgi:hypothetical protein
MTEGRVKPVIDRKQDLSIQRLLIIAPAKTQPKADQPSSWLRLHQERKGSILFYLGDLGAFARLMRCNGGLNDTIEC